MVTVDTPQKCIICFAPHTSNWDFIIGKLYSSAEDLRSNFLMKKEWFKGPLGSLFRYMVVFLFIGINTQSMTDNLASEAMNSKSFSSLHHS